MFLNLIYRIKNSLLIDIPDCDRKEFNISINKINMVRAKLTAITFIVLEAFMLIISFAVKGDNFFRQPDIYYGILYLSVIIGMAVHLFVFSAIGKNLVRNSMFFGCQVCYD